MRWDELQRLVVDDPLPRTANPCVAHNINKILYVLLVATPHETPAQRNLERTKIMASVKRARKKRKHGK